MHVAANVAPEVGYEVTRRSRLILALGLILAAVPAKAAPPDIVRIRVPAARVPSFFAPGTQLRILSPEAFGSLLDDANRQAATMAMPRLIRAHHRARWTKDLLSGSSELIAELPLSGPVALTLDPWTPMILPRMRQHQVVGSLETGKSVIWLDPAAGRGPTTTVSLDWELRARPDSEGRVFALGLPGDETSDLALELPEGWVPAGPGERRRGPLQAARNGFQTWWFHGRPGHSNLQLKRPGQTQTPRDGASLWVSGPTRVVLGDNQAVRAANWETEWSVQSEQRGVARFTAVMDPGLDLIDVSGPDVIEFQADREGPATRVKVSFSGNARSPTTVHFRAHARVAIEGSWRVPAIRPVDAIWTGGSTTLVLDPLHVVQDCREIAGRRVPMRGGGASGADTLVFEASSPDSVAELVLRQPRVEESCLVRGRLVAGSAVPALECELVGLGGRSSAYELDIDLPPSWIAGRVQWSGVAQSLAWNSTMHADGGTRLHVFLPGREGTADDRVLIVRATSAAPGRGPLILPRVRPIRTTIKDEVWVALVDNNTSLTPISARGLAWIDPARVEGVSPLPTTPGMELQPALAWRWIGENAEARVDRERIESEPTAEIRCRTRVTREGRLLEVDGQVLLECGGKRPATLPLWISEPGADVSAWSFRGGPDLHKLSFSPLDDKARSRLGFPAEGAAWSLPLVGISPAGQARITFRARLPWKRHGAVPLVSAPRQLSARTTILIETSTRTRSWVEAVGIRRLDTATGERLGRSWRNDASSDLPDPAVDAPDDLLAHAFYLTEPGGSLNLTTEELVRVPQTGLIRDACLTSLLHPQGPWLHRLRLLLHAEKSGELRLALPARASLVRTQLDGADSSPAWHEGKYVVTIPAGSVGQRFKTVNIDYESSGTELKNGDLLQPVLPELELPCLSFCWELIVPPRWAAREHGPGLHPTEPPPVPAWPFSALGVPEARWPGPTAGESATTAQAIRRLDELLAGLAAEGLTFAECFTRWDSATYPLVVDRLAVSGAGYGPRSRCLPLGADPRGQSHAQRTLQQYGLALVPVDSILVVTSQAEAARFDQSARWLPALGEVMLWGSDRSDRFQSVARWRGELTPAETPTSGLADSLRPPPGWSTSRFSASSWPLPTTRVQIRDERAGIVPGWALALVLLAALSSTRMSPRWGVRVPLILMAASVLLHLGMADSWANLSAGLFLGAMTCLLHRLGSLIAVRPRREQVPPARRPAPRVRLTRSLFRAAPFVLVSFLVSHERAEARRGPERPLEDQPILALLPYEGTFEPGQPPLKAVLRESDYQRLLSFARPSPATRVPLLILTDATHHITRVGERDVILSSELAVRVTAAGSAIWRVPIAGAREITATVEGRPVPVWVEGGGRLAAIPVEGPGTVRLAIRRMATLAREGSVDSLDFPVNPLPSARLIVDGPATSGAPRLLNARGALKPGPGPAVTAELGPADQVEIQWGAPDGASPVAGLTVDGVTLWDIEPAGDRVQARFTYRGARQLSTLRFKMDPGLIVRSAQIPGMVSSSWDGAADQPVWTVRLDPPLPDGTTIKLDLWRPLGPGPSGGTGESSGDRPSTESARRFPLLEPLQAERLTSLLGVRRPGHWTGRLEAPTGAETINDESFVKIWGALPDERLTLSGTARLVRGKLPTFRTAPAPALIKARPTLELRVDAGRVDVLFDAELFDLGGTVNSLAMTVPQELNVLGVACEGLTDWSRPDAGRLLLRFDRETASSRRRLKVSGWMPTADDPLKVGVQRRRMPTPWLDIPGMETLPGILVIVSDTRVEAVGAAGMTRVSSGSAGGAGTAEAQTALTYRIDDPARLGSLQWTSTPPRVNVLIESQMTIHPDSAEWVATLRYDVAGGALDAIHVKLPTAWALKSRIQFAGGEPFHRSELPVPGFVTFLNLRPEHPIWGSQRLVLRSALPLVPGQEMVVPDITPLGLGFADTYVGLVFAAGSIPATGGSSGLHRIPYANRFQAPEFARAPGSESRAFRVDRKDWALKVQIPPRTEPAEVGEESVGVVAADLDITVSPDGARLGRAVYETRARTGRFLVAELPPASTFLWSTVDQTPASPLRSAAGRWLLPVGENGPSRVALFWREPAADAAPAPAAWSLTLPRAGAERIPTLLTVRLPDGLSLTTSPPSLEASAPDRMALERADRISRQIAEFIAQMDRSSGRDREQVASLLISHELALRTAERSMRWSTRRGDLARRERAERDAEVIQSTRKAVIESLRAAALEDEIAAAQNYLGAASGHPPSTDPVTVPEPVGPDRLRDLGQPSYLAGFSAGLNEPPTTIHGSLETPGRPESDTPDRARSMLMLGILIILGLATVSRSSAGGPVLVLLVATLALLAFMGGPLALAIASVVAIIGWFWRPTSSSNIPGASLPARVLTTG